MDDEVGSGSSLLEEVGSPELVEVGSGSSELEEVGSGSSELEEVGSIFLNGSSSFVKNKPSDKLFFFSRDSTIRVSLKGDTRVFSLTLKT